MSKRKNEEFLRDMTEAVQRIELYMKNMSYDKFLKDNKTQDAVVRNLEILGEAAKNISDAIKKKYAQIPWKGLAGVRDRLIHHYFGVNFDIVWTVVKKELPQCAPKLKKLLNKSSNT